MSASGAVRRRCTRTSRTTTGRRARRPFEVFIATAALCVGTAAPAWGASAWLAQPDVSPAGASASVPGTAMNAAGDAVVTWQDAFAGSAHVSLRPAGGPFAAPVDFAGG